MEYTKPVFDVGEDTDFIIRPFTYPDDIRDKLVFLFDLPPEISVNFPAYSFKGSTFDYFNPLMLYSENIGKVTFSETKFDCYELICPAIVRDLFSCRISKGGQFKYAYTPKMFIRYPSMDVDYTTGSIPQMCDAFEYYISRAGMAVMVNELMNSVIEEVTENMP
jgi:hypothetical protein